MLPSIEMPRYGALLARSRPKVVRTAMPEIPDLRVEGKILSGEESELQVLFRLTRQRLR